LLKIAIAHSVAAVPPDRPEHDLALEVTPLEDSMRVDGDPAGDKAEVATTSVLMEMLDAMHRPARLPEDHRPRGG